VSQAQVVSSGEVSGGDQSRERILNLFRRWGYLQADLDPLGHFPRLDYSELRISGPDAQRAREIYCGSIGAEFMHIPYPERRQWIIDRLEGPQSEVNREAILNQLLEADIVYVRDLAHPERMTSEQLAHLAMIAFHIYGSVDLAVFCIIELQQRGRAPEDAVEQLMQLFE